MPRAFCKCGADNERAGMMDDLAERFDHLHDCEQTEVETKDGPLVLFHRKPLTEDDLLIFKKFTREEIKTLLHLELGFKTHKL